jgi:hypothetical protein
MHYRHDIDGPTPAAPVQPMRAAKTVIGLLVTCRAPPIVAGHNASIAIAGD